MMKRFLSVAFAILFIGAGLLAPVTASAIDSTAKDKFKNSVNATGGSEASGVPETIKNVINILLYIAGVTAVIVIVVGSLRFVTSEGDAQAANKAKNAVAFALVGLVLAALAYAIVNFVLDGL